MPFLPPSARGRSRRWEEGLLSPLLKDSPKATLRDPISPGSRGVALRSDSPGEPGVTPKVPGVPDQERKRGCVRDAYPNYLYPADVSHHFAGWGGGLFKYIHF